MSTNSIPRRNPYPFHFWTRSKENTLVESELANTVKTGCSEFHGTTQWNSQFTGIWSESKFSPYGVKISFHYVLEWNHLSLSLDMKFTCRKTDLWEVWCTTLVQAIFPVQAQGTFLMVVKVKICLNNSFHTGVRETMIEVKGGNSKDTIKWVNLQPGIWLV